MSRVTKKEVKDFVAVRIRQARQQAKLSQRDLGKELGVSDKTVSAWEVGRAEPSLEMLYNIGETTNQPINFFLRDQSQEYSIPSKLAAIEKELHKVRQLLHQEDE